MAEISFQPIVNEKDADKVEQEAFELENLPSGWQIVYGDLRELLTRDSTEWVILDKILDYKPEPEDKKTQEDKKV